MILVHYTRPASTANNDPLGQTHIRADQTMVIGSVWSVPQLQRRYRRELPMGSSDATANKPTAQRNAFARHLSGSIRYLGPTVGELRQRLTTSLAAKCHDPPNVPVVKTAATAAVVSMVRDIKLQLQPA